MKMHEKSERQFPHPPPPAAELPSSDERERRVGQTYLGLTFLLIRLRVSYQRTLVSRNESGFRIKSGM